MNQKYVTKLQGKTQAELIEIINGLTTITGVGEFLEFNYLLTPEEKIKSLTKTFNKYKNRRKFHDYYQTIEFFNLLTTEVLSPIKQNLIAQAPLASSALLQSVIDSFERLCADKDDSSGCAIEFLDATAQLWAASWACISDRDLNALAQLVYNYHKNHGYLYGEQLFAYFKPALGTTGLLMLESLLKDEKNLWLYIIELQQNTNKYIQALSAINDTSNHNQLKVAQMLIDDLRADEAINKLLMIKTNTLDAKSYPIRQDLLIQAYLEEGLMVEAQTIRRESFEHTLQAKYYTSYIVDASLKEQEQLRLMAIEQAKLAKDFNTSLIFLEDISEYDALEDLIITNLSKLDQYNYSYYRKLSKNLAAHGKFLAACLIRRSLIAQILEKAQSKYYDYAVSDLKLGLEFGAQVKNWQSFENNHQYLEQLKITHKRKVSFWDRVEL